MDSYRAEQKLVCGGPYVRGRAAYGCPCCRKLSNLRDLKLFGRRRARRKLKGALLRLLANLADR